MYKKLRNNTEGFTIVETLIVLAIAATIIVVVLLAVPALQRSSRNTQYKTAANDIASSISEYESNNNGTLPTASVFTGTGTGVTFVAGAYKIGTTTYSIPGSTTLFQPAQITPPASGAIPTSVTIGTNALTGTTADKITYGTIGVYLGVNCPSPNNPATPLTNFTASTTSAAVIYPIEGANTVGCVQA